MQMRQFSLDTGSDPQFMPQRKAAPAAAPAAAAPAADASVAPAGAQTASDETAQMLEEIKAVVTAHKVVLFMKGTPDRPQCGFSSRVVQMLGRLNISYESCNVLESPVLREAIKTYSDWPTLPQLYVNGEFIGGCDIVTSMFASGELHDLVGVPKPEPAPESAAPTAAPKA